MNRRVFVDTNVLLYSIDATDPVKQAAAHDWLEFLWQDGSGRISWQVLHEFFVNAVRKMKIPSEDVRPVETLTWWSPVDSSLGLLRRAWYWTDTAGVPYWDGLILAAAESSGCELLLSEDFQSGRRFDSILVVNPFQVAPGQASTLTV